MTEKTGKGLALPERVRQSIASAVRERGAQARMVSTQGRGSMRPPQGHIVAAATSGEISGIRGPARIVRQLEFYKTFYGPVVRLAFTVYPMEGEPLSTATLLNVSQVSGDAALTCLGRQTSIRRERRPRLRVLEGDPERPRTEARGEEGPQDGPRRLL